MPLIAARHAIAGLTCLVAVAGATATATPTTAVTHTRETQAALTPADALTLLREGNARFAAGTTLRRDLTEQIAVTRGGQHPFAAVLGCIDSRVPPELIFDTGLGDVFSARVAGNIVDDALLGSLEFATQVAGARAIVVLGHTECGAVKGACDGVHLGHLGAVLGAIAPAVAASRADVPAPHDATNPAFVAHVTETNVRLQAKALTARSPILAKRVGDGQLVIAPALYDVGSGQVRFLD